MFEKELRLNDPMPIGKFKGRKLKDIACIDPGYLSWFRDNVKRYRITDSVWKLAVSTGIQNSEEQADRYGTAGDWGFPEY